MNAIAVRYANFLRRVEWTSCWFLINKKFKKLSKFLVFSAYSLIQANKMVKTFTKRVFEVRGRFSEKRGFSRGHDYSSYMQKVTHAFCRMKLFHAESSISSK